MLHTRCCGLAPCANVCVCVCEQIRRRSSEHCGETPCDAEQVLPAHRDGVPGLLPALEAAGTVRLGVRSLRPVSSSFTVCLNVDQ